MFALLRRAFGTGCDLENGGDDVRVPSATAQMSGEHFADLRFAGVGDTGEKIRTGHENPRRAESALQRVVAAKRELQRGQFVTGRRQSLGRYDVPAFSGNREREAGTLGDAVYGDRACAAHAMLAADVNAGRAESITQEIRKQSTRFAFAAAFDSVQAQGNGM